MWKRTTDYDDLDNNLSVPTDVLTLEMLHSQRKYYFTNQVHNDARYTWTKLT